MHYYSLLQARSDEKKDIAGSFQVTFGGAGIFLVTFKYNASEAFVNVGPQSVESGDKIIEAKPKYPTDSDVLNGEVHFSYHEAKP